MTIGREKPSFLSRLKGDHRWPMAVVIVALVFSLAMTLAERRRGSREAASALAREHSLHARIAEQERALSAGERDRQALGTIRPLVAALLAGEKEAAALDREIASLRAASDKQLAALRAGKKKKRKQVELESRRIRDMARQQIGALEERRALITGEATRARASLDTLVDTGAVGNRLPPSPVSDATATSKAAPLTGSPPPAGAGIAPPAPVSAKTRPTSPVGDALSKPGTLPRSPTMDTGAPK